MFARWPGGDERSLVPVAFGPGSAGLRHRLPAPGSGGGPRILVVMDEDPFESEAGFAGLGLRAELLRALSSLGYEEPTPIQQEAIPPLVAGNDLVGQAATGPERLAAWERFYQALFACIDFRYVN